MIDQNLIVDVEFENCIESGWSNQDLHWLLQKANVTYLDTEECKDNENIGKYVSFSYKIYIMISLTCTRFTKYYKLNI